MFEDLENSNIAKIQEIKTSLDSMDFTEAAQKLSSLVDSNLYELNKKMVMEIYLESIANGQDLDSSHIAVLEPISMLHPLIGGEGVFWACAMLDMPVNNVLPQLRKAKKDKGSKNNLQDIHVFPNPVGDVLNINHHYGVPLTLCMTDVAGKTVLTSCLDSKEEIQKVNTCMLEPGTYFLKLMQVDEVIYADKLIIVR